MVTGLWGSWFSWAVGSCIGKWAAFCRSYGTWFGPERRPGCQIPSNCCKESTDIDAIFQMVAWVLQWLGALGEIALLGLFTVNRCAYTRSKFGNVIFGGSQVCQICNADTNTRCPATGPAVEGSCSEVDAVTGCVSPRTAYEGPWGRQIGKFDDGASWHNWQVHAWSSLVCNFFTVQMVRLAVRSSHVGWQEWVWGSVFWLHWNRDLIPQDCNFLEEEDAFPTCCVSDPGHYRCGLDTGMVGDVCNVACEPWCLSFWTYLQGPWNRWLPLQKIMHFWWDFCIYQ